MTDYIVSVDEITRATARSGFEFEQLTRVREDVFRGRLTNKTLDGSSDVFVRLYDSERRDALETFSTIATEVSHPPCQLIDGEYVCLILSVAEGRPLSQVLPVVLLPGLRSYYRDRLITAYTEIGASIGRLHDRTVCGEGPIFTRDELEKALERTVIIKEQFGTTLANKARNVLQLGQEYATPRSIVYGDRSPHNLFYKRGKITHIDVMGKKGSTLTDHATAILGSRLMIARLPYVDESFATVLEQAYWDGYSTAGNAPDIKPTWLDIRLLSKYLGLLNLYRGNPSSLNTRLTAFVDPPILHKWTELLLNGFEL